MGIFDKIRDFVTVEEDEYEDDETYEYDDDEIEYKEPSAPLRTATTQPPISSPKYTTPTSEGATGYKSYRQPAVETQRSSYSNRENVIAMPGSNADAIKRITQRFKIVVVDPKGFEDCPILVDSLKAKKPVIINLEALETDKARKIFDFLSGATYALSGNVQKIAANIFIFMPANVDVSAPIEDGSSSSYQSGASRSPFA